MSDRQKTGLTRRSFVKWTTAASAMAALPLSRQLHAATGKNNPCRRDGCQRAVETGRLLA
ncbi:twin-arginine translocation signal domain-containing protein [Morganella psychrotolerans]|uniref:twin-arginine translocation signal domain-containing protein n=1 Tax=Morganella psychrotolerans TaxID=368603 RepID=UPI001F47F489|nr:twin-arginine translocation signal domain-containing protein [Morganella psychrotolerans]